MDTTDPHMQERHAEKAEAMAYIAAALGKLDQERRNPDAWERVCLAQALGAIFSGCYGLALAEAGLAMTPPPERAPNFAGEPMFTSCNLPLLWQVYREADATPVLAYPHIGPIKISPQGRP